MSLNHLSQNWGQVQRSAEVLCFEGFTLDCRGRALYYADEYVDLKGKPLQVLICLARRAGNPVLFETLASEIWKHADRDSKRKDFKNALEQIIYRIRHAIGDKTDPHRIIVTDRRNGYIFVPEVVGANLREVKLRLANLRGANLSGAKVVPSGPSTIGVDTIYRSAGKIPESFLRDAGLPENFVAYMRSLTGAAFEFCSCFISYSSQDQAFAERLHADLRSRNLRCWFAPEDLKIGDRFQERIEESIRLYDKVMIILSEASIRSRWVEREINAAREREDGENRVVLFPIRIDDAVMEAPEPWAAEIRRTRHIGDFRQWKDRDSYEQSFERLLRDLKSNASTEPAKTKTAPGRAVD